MSCRVAMEQALCEKAPVPAQALVEYAETGAAEDIKNLWSRVSAKLGELSPLAIL